MEDSNAVRDDFETATRVLKAVVSFGLLVRPRREQIVTEGPAVAAQMVANTIRDNAKTILPFLKNGRLAARRCLGDDCEQPILFIDGEGYCQKHGMTTQFFNRID